MPVFRNVTLQCLTEIGKILLLFSFVTFFWLSVLSFFWLGFEVVINKGVNRFANINEVKICVTIKLADQHRHMVMSNSVKCLRSCGVLILHSFLWEHHEGREYFLPSFAILRTTSKDFSARSSLYFISDIKPIFQLPFPLSY